ncbi:MAG: YihY/virulence factor BrkB family protein [Bdellovibrionota bacterium]
MDVKESIQIIKEASTGWSNDKCPKLAAALSFYAMIAMAPLLVLLVSISSLVVDQSQAEEHILKQIAEFIGYEGAKTIQNMLSNASQSKAGTVAAIVGFVTFLIGSSGMFVELRDSLNTIWNVDLPKKKSALKSHIKDRLISFLMILGVGFILVASLITSAFIAATEKNLGSALPHIGAFWAIVHALTFIAVIAILFAMLFKFLPQTKVPWKDLWLGALLTSLLFNIGKSFIGAYLGRGTFNDVYGASGSFIILLLWVYYSAQIFFWGAEFTQAYAKRMGSRKKNTKS